MQADSDDSSDVVAKFSTKLSSLFTRKPLRILDSFRETLFTSEFIYPELITLIYPRESRRRKWKSWRWMQRPTTHFENTELNGLDLKFALSTSQICSRFSLVHLLGYTCTKPTGLPTASGNTKSFEFILVVGFFHIAYRQKEKFLH